MMNEPRPLSVRVLVLADEPRLREQLVCVVSRTLRASGDIAAIECVHSSTELTNAHARSPADLIVVDAEAVATGSDTFVEEVRHTPGGSDAEVLLLGSDSGSRRSAELGARELPSPPEPHVLGLVIARFAARLVERRATTMGFALTAFGL